MIRLLAALLRRRHGRHRAGRPPTGTQVPAEDPAFTLPPLAWSGLGWPGTNQVEAEQARHAYRTDRRAS